MLYLLQEEDKLQLVKLNGVQVLGTLLDITLFHHLKMEELGIQDGLKFLGLIQTILLKVGGQFLITPIKQCGAVFILLFLIFILTLLKLFTL